MYSRDFFLIRFWECQNIDNERKKFLNRTQNKNNKNNTYYVSFILLVEQMKYTYTRKYLITFRYRHVSTLGAVNN